MPQTVRVPTNAGYFNASMALSAAAELLQGGRACAAPADVRRVLPAVAARRGRVPSPHVMDAAGGRAPTATGAGAPGSAAGWKLTSLAGNYSPAALPGTPATASVPMASWPALPVSGGAAAASARPSARCARSDAPLSSAFMPLVGLRAEPLPEPFENLGGPWGVHGRQPIGPLMYQRKLNPEQRCAARPGPLRVRRPCDLPQRSGPRGLRRRR